VGAKIRVHPRLPTSSLSPIGLDDVGVEAKRLIDLRTGYPRAAAPVSNSLGRFRTKDLAD
jgi:hypothetical protein